MQEATLKRVQEHEQSRTPVLWIPEDGSSFVPGQGYRVAIVIAGEDGYRWTGTWPYDGSPGTKLPWFWGGPKQSPAALAAAQFAATQHNEIAGVHEEEATLIVARSMARAARPAYRPGPLS